MLWRPFLCVAVAVVLAGCNQTVVGSFEPTSDAQFTARDRQYLASSRARVQPVNSIDQRHVVSYPRNDAPGTIVVDPTDRFLYFVLPGNRAIRYGVTVGEEGQDWHGTAIVGRKREWPDWTPPSGLRARLAARGVRVPAHMAPGPENPMGSRGLYLYQNGRDTLYRIHGTNQPEYIGQAISSGCIRMTNEDAIDLYNRVPVGSRVVVLPPGQSVANARAPYMMIQAAIVER